MSTTRLVVDLRSTPARPRSTRPLRLRLAASGLAASLLGITAHAQPPAQPSARPPSARPPGAGGTRPSPADSVAEATMAGHDHGGEMTGMAANDMTGHGSPEEALHLRLTPTQRPTHTDSLRAAALVDTVRRTLSQYANPAVAEADGYRLFLPNVPQAVYHYTNYGHAFQEAFRFDPTRPTSLLYRAAPGGRRVLLGAMYTAPAGWALDRLDARVPLSIAHWHQHVNWCLPAKGDEVRWRETRDGRPVFGPASPIATRAACDAAGGVFYPRVFNWMVHVNAFAADSGQRWAH